MRIENVPFRIQMLEVKMRQTVFFCPHALHWMDFPIALRRHDISCNFIHANLK